MADITIDFITNPSVNIDFSNSQGPAGATGPAGQDGPVGPTGPTGPAGVGIIAGGTTNQSLTKIDGTEYNTQWTTIDKTFVGLSNIDNTSDANKPISIATQNSLNNKVDKESGKSLVLDTEITKLSGIESGATANQTDAYLLSRANHTGTQSADTLTDGITNKAFLDTERTKLAGIGTGAKLVSVVAGANITVNNTDPANPIISSTASASGDVIGPASAVNNNFASFDTTTGKLIKDSGSKASDFQTALGYTAENQANKVILVNGASTDTEYPSAKSVYTLIANSLSNVAYLGSTQTFTALHRFLDSTFGLQNIANTFTSFFTNTNTASRTYTLPDKDGTVAMTSDITDATLSTSDITTNNATTLKHGFLPKLSGNSSQYLDGNGNYAIPSGVVNSYKSQSFTAQTSINVVHNFGAYPVVSIVDNTGAVLIPLGIVHNTLNDFTITFTSSKTGTILATVGSPQPQNLISGSSNYTVLTTDYFIEVTSANKTITLPTAVGNTGRIFVIKNITTGAVSVNTTSSQTIDGLTIQTINGGDSMSVYSNGSNYLFY